MASYTSSKYHNGFAGGGSHSADLEQAAGADVLENGREDYRDKNVPATAAGTIMTTDTLYRQFSQDKQTRSRSSFTLPRSWSSWRMKSSNDLASHGRDQTVSLDDQQIPLDQTSTTSDMKLKRRSSFRNLMDRFRRYKSTDSLEVRRRPPNGINGEHVQYVQENPGRIVVPVVGLQNHGNSCYINAVLQCLNNTAQMYEFFISGRYKRDLARRNRENAKKFGTQGELTEACGHLVQSLGRATYTPDISNSLIQVVAKYWAQFHDGGEQDAQEFWIWLMDRMHEDLNRKGRRKLKIRKSHKADDVLAAATEEANGSSIISRLFSALSRSSLTCVKCGQQSNTFEDFTCLPIPLPQTDIRPLFVNVILHDAQSHVRRYGFNTSLDATVKDVKDLVTGKIFVKPEELLLLEVNEGGFQKTLTEDGDTDGIHDLEDLFALELLKKTGTVGEEDNGRINVVILHVTMEDGLVRRISAPRLVQVPRDISYQGLESAIVSNLDTNAWQLLQSPPLRIHLVERDEYLKRQDDHPLLTETVDQCLSMSGSVASLRHLKLYVQWEAKDVQLVCGKLIREKFADDPTVQAVKETPEASRLTTLSDCLDLFMKEETVDMDKQWECPNCGASQIGIIKRGTLWTLPEILVIHLKRFRQTASTRFKLTTMVEFPLTDLDMSRYLTRDDDIDWRSRGKSGATKKNPWLPWAKIRKPPDSQLNQVHSYSLFGVVNHHGRLNSGHYTACCRHPADGTWYLYDDLRVKTVEDTKDIITKDAYILFYQRQPLHNYPNLYYSDFSKSSPSNMSMFDLRTPTPRPSRSTDDIPQTMAQEEKRLEQSELSRTAHIYASLPRLPRRSIVHHPPGPPGTNSLTNADSRVDTPFEHVYQRHPAVSGPVPNTTGPAGEHGAVVPGDEAWSGQRHVPQLLRYQPRPIQESCV